MARFDLSDGEWTIIAPLLPNKPRGVPRRDDRRVLNAFSTFYAPARRGATCRNAMALTRPATTALTAGRKAGCGCAFLRLWRSIRRARCI
jgi:transposase